MHKISLPWVVWLLLVPFLAVEASPQFTTTLVTRTWEFLKGGTSTPAVVNCMDETSSKLVTWQNPDFPKNESLPGICILTLNPAEGTCAYRLNFDTLDLSVKKFSYSQILSSVSCPTDNPYIKVSTVNYTAPARCQNLTGYEAFVQLPKESTEPVVLLLQTDPNFKTSFRVNISSVACSDISTFKSPNVCGIKNQKLNKSPGNRLRFDALPQDSTLLKKEPKSSDTLLKTEVVQDEDSLDVNLGVPGDSQVETVETIEEARRSRQLSDEYSVETITDNPVFRRLTVEQIKKKNKNKKQDGKVKSQPKPEKKVEISEDAKEYAEKLKKAGDIISFGLGVGIENGNFKYQPNKDTRIVGVAPIPNEWPWMAFIQYTVKIPCEIPFLGCLEFPTGCNGALLDESHVITQASCLPGSSVFRSTLDSVRVILGDHDLLNQTETETPSLNVSVSKISFPMTFSSIGVTDDIAVLTLSEPVNFTDTVRPVCLPVSYNQFPGDSGVVAEWTGITGVNDLASVTSPSLNLGFGTGELNAADVKVLDKSACNETLSQIALELSLLSGKDSIDADNYVCLVDQDTKNPLCEIGLGTPLVQEDITNAYYLTGVSSVAQTCFSNAPNIFTAIKPDNQFLNLALT